MKPVFSPNAAEPPDADQSQSWKTRLTAIYGPDRAEQVAPAVESLLNTHSTQRSIPPPERWTEADVWLITYPDQFQRSGTPPLTTLAAFLDSNLRGWINGVHILPFFPSTSDEGFSITDFTEVDPRLGSWQDIEQIAADWRLMVDAVVNHASAQGRWFESWRSGDPVFADFFRTAAPDADLSSVVRARQHPLLTRFETADGARWVWTTFSADQVDLDYRNPAVLVRVLDVLLMYVAHGADVVRLDAVGFLWKEEGSSSINLPETHRIIQFLRACLDVCYPGIVLITETNVPHEENLSYLGDRTHPEAGAVYQFPLPPLTLHAFTTGDATQLVAWLAALEAPLEGTTYLNFLSSHDGVGLRPLEGLISSADVQLLVAHAEANGGLVSSRADGEGSPIPYELNATWFDLVRGPTTGEDAMARHVASHAVMLAVRGVPALYVQGLLAGENDIAGVSAFGHARSINRRRFVDGDLDELGVRLDNSDSPAARSVAALRQMIELRASSPAFHPDTEQTILDTPAQVVGIERRPETSAAARVYVNVSGTSVTIPAETDRASAGNRWSADAGVLELGPWGYAWVLE